MQTDGNWTTESDFELDESKVRSYMDRFESLSVFELSDLELAGRDDKYTICHRR